MFYIFHRLGLQSNIIITANYHTPTRQTITRPLAIAALRTVVHRQPALLCVYPRRPSKNKGNFQLHRALLRKVDLSRCIEFLDEKEYGARIGPEVLEKLHNTWDWQRDEDTDRPWFKVVIAGGTDVAVVLHHGVGDGVSGAVFHREFLAALNSICDAQTPSKELEAASAQVVSLDPTTTILPVDPLTISDAKPVLARPLWTTLVCILLPLLLPWLVALTDLPSPAKPPASLSAVGDVSLRTVTSISTYRISSATMDKILKSCRAHKTTFTPLFIVMLTATLATDYYPKAIWGASRYSTQLRPWLDLKKLGGSTPAGVVANCAGGTQFMERLQPYRRILVTESDQSRSRINAEVAWDLVRNYRKCLPPDYGPHLLRQWKGGNRMGDDLDNQMATTFPIFRAFTPTCLVSNMGPFSVAMEGESLEDIKPRTWTIDDMQFSAGPTNGRVGSNGPLFSIAGVRGGDTVINAGFQESVIPRARVEDMLNKVVEKILALVDCDDIASLRGPDATDVME